MFCQKCGGLMEQLPDLYFHTGKNWYGCKNCNIVIEHNFGSVTGKESGTELCHLSYQEFMGQIAKKKAD